MKPVWILLVLLSITFVFGCSDDDAKDPVARDKIKELQKGLDDLKEEVGEKDLKEHSGAEEDLERAQQLNARAKRALQDRAEGDDQIANKADRDPSLESRQRETKEYRR